jgi:hypothetical protein
LKKLSTFLSVHPNPPLPVLACDTLVSLDGAFIGKAKDRDEAYQQLFRFSAKRQMVESGLGVVRRWTHLLRSGCGVRYVPYAGQGNDRGLSGYRGMAGSRGFLSDSREKETR